MEFLPFSAVLVIFKALIREPCQNLSNKRVVAWCQAVLGGVPLMVWQILRAGELGFFWPHLPCEISEAHFRQFHWVFPQILVDFQSISIDFCLFFQSLSVNF